MKDRTLLFLLLGITAATLYITYQTAMGLQSAADKIKNPLNALGL